MWLRRNRGRERQHDLTAGEALVLLGHNGVGKSTLLKTIAAELTPVSGTVALDGESYPQAGRVHEIGFAPQSIALLPRLTVEQHLRTCGAVLNLTGDALRAQIEHTLKTVALLERRGQRVETLSGGLQRRVNIAASLMGMPKVLLLDEPQVGVDQEGRETLVETLRALLAYGTTLILVTHDLDFARSLATRVGVLAAGGMAVEGAPRDHRTRSPTNSWSASDLRTARTAEHQRPRVLKRHNPFWRSSSARQMAPTRR